MGDLGILIHSQMGGPRDGPNILGWLRPALAPHTPSPEDRYNSKPLPLRVAWRGGVMDLRTNPGHHPPPLQAIKRADKKSGGEGGSGGPEDESRPPPPPVKSIFLDLTPPPRGLPPTGGTCAEAHNRKTPGVKNS